MTGVSIRRKRERHTDKRPGMTEIEIWSDVASRKEYQGANVTPKSSEGAWPI